MEESLLSLDCIPGLVFWLGATVLKDEDRVIWSDGNPMFLEI